MRLKPGKTYIKKERKIGFIIAFVIVFAVMMTVVVIELLPWGVPELGYTEQNGIGRSFMYPFVFTDSINDLYIMDENSNVRMIDNNAESVVHDSADDRIYYLKNNILYEYNIKENNRFSLCKNVSEFSILGNKRGIICKDELGRIIMYMFKGKEIKVLSQEPYTEASYAVSQEGVLYSNGNKLYYCNYLGKIYTISENFNSSKPFYISENNDICYFDNNTMHISDNEGNIKCSFVNSEPVLFRQETILIQPTTEEKTGTDAVPFKYFLSDIAMVLDSEENSSIYSAGALKYFNGKDLKDISENIYRVIYYSQEEDFLIYNVLNGNKADIYLTVKGKKPTKQIECKPDSVFLFDERSNYLYIKENGKLRRYDIFDVDYKITEIANDVETMYDYLNKPFIAYTDKKQENLYLIEKDKVETINILGESRLYGRSHENYLLCNLKENGLMTLDYVLEGKMTRIADNVGANIFFDRDFDNIIFNENSKLYLWKSNAKTLIGNYAGVKAVKII